MKPVPILFAVLDSGMAGERHVSVLQCSVFLGIQANVGPEDDWFETGLFLN